MQSSSSLYEYIRSKIKVGFALKTEKTLFGKWYTLMHWMGPYYGEKQFEENDNIDQIIESVNKSYKGVL
jgi:hypothetical protein